MEYNEAQRANLCIAYAREQLAVARNCRLVGNPAGWWQTAMRHARNFRDRAVKLRRIANSKGQALQSGKYTHCTKCGGDLVVPSHVYAGGYPWCDECVVEHGVNGVRRPGFPLIRIRLDENGEPVHQAWQAWDKTWTSIPGFASAGRIFMAEPYSEGGYRHVITERHFRNAFVEDMYDGYLRRIFAVEGPNGETIHVITCTGVSTGKILRTYWKEAEK
ncbi:hypothetical protein [Streptomyces acidiscabies]|uniref:Uncharacterized protein n=1 Tax=Streptomyces acidiscabies TaxID=42234 RepID=A0ABU4LYM5_9ACTN|nr:hypothetical protein [Streptomyces acidiscabies]MDX3020017.1 hypothetical protein [Streptomyces acidiscabies]